MPEEPLPPQTKRPLANVKKGPHSSAIAVCPCGAQFLTNPQQRGVAKCSVCGKIVKVRH